MARTRFLALIVIVLVALLAAGVARSAEPPTDRDDAAAGSGGSFVQRASPLDLGLDVLPEDLAWCLTLALLGDDPAAAVDAPVALETLATIGPTRGQLIGKGRTISAALADRCIEVAAEVDPALAKRLMEVRAKDPEAFARIVGESGRRLVGFAQLKVQEPRLYELKVQELRAHRDVARVAAELRAVRAGDSPDRDQRAAELQDKLRKLVQVQVAQSLAIRGESLILLKEHVQALRDELTREAFNFPGTVDRRMQELIGPSPTGAARDVVETAALNDVPATRDHE